MAYKNENKFLPSWILLSYSKSFENPKYNYSDSSRKAKTT